MAAGMPLQPPLVPVVMSRSVSGLRPEGDGLPPERMGIVRGSHHRSVDEMTPLPRLSGFRTGHRLAVLAIVLLFSCTPEAFLNNTSSLGGTNPGQRGDIRLLFINNTPYRAIFTFGTYDPQDQEDEPQYLQYVVDAGQTATDFNRGLSGNTSTDEITFECGRTVSIGDQQMITRILDKDVDPLDGSLRYDVALREGVFFSDRPIDDPEPNADNGTEVASAEPRVTLQGAEFQCDSLLIYSFELDDTQPGGVRIDIDVVLP